MKLNEDKLKAVEKSLREENENMKNSAQIEEKSVN